MSKAGPMDFQRRADAYDRRTLPRASAIRRRLNRRRAAEGGAP